MANKKIEALKEQLEMYTAEINKYEKEFLANDGKIDEQEQNILDSIRVMLDKIKTKLKSNKQNTSDKEDTSTNDICTKEAISGIKSLLSKFKTPLKK